VAHALRMKRGQIDVRRIEPPRRPASVSIRREGRGFRARWTAIWCPAGFHGREKIHLPTCPYMVSALPFGRLARYRTLSHIGIQRAVEGCAARGCSAPPPLVLDLRDHRMTPRPLLGLVFALGIAACSASQSGGDDQTGDDQDVKEKKALYGDDRVGNMFK